MHKYKISIPIIRKGYEKTHSAKFKGTLNIVTNKHGVIYDWKIVFTNVFLDAYSTNAWFINKNKNFQRREMLFKELGIRQEQRPSQKSRKLIELTSDQLVTLNNFFNDRKKYNSTIKNIVAVLKGNNPGGEAGKPSSAEMIINDDSSSLKNFVILIDDLVMKQKVEYNAASIGAKKITITELVSLNSDLKNAFEFMQKNKNWHSWKTYLFNIKTYYKQYNVDIKKAEMIANRARSKYSINVNKNIKNLPFGFNSPKEFSKCHIYEVHDLRDMIVEALRENKDYSKYEKMIEDENNFIPLPGEPHRQFDRYQFTYKADGTIYAINEEGFEYINKYLETKFKKIPEFFLTPKRIEYIKKRNKNIIW